MATKAESFFMSKAYALSTLGTKPSFSSHLAKYAAISGESVSGGRPSAVIAVSSPAVAGVRCLDARPSTAVLLFRLAIVVPLGRRSFLKSRRWIGPHYRLLR